MNRLFSLIRKSKIATALSGGWSKIEKSVQALWPKTTKTWVAKILIFLLGFQVISYLVTVVSQAGSTFVSGISIDESLKVSKPEDVKRWFITALEKARADLENARGLSLNQLNLLAGLEEGTLLSAIELNPPNGARIGVETSTELSQLKLEADLLKIPLIETNIPFSLRSFRRLFGHRFLDLSIVKVGAQIGVMAREDHLEFIWPWPKTVVQQWAVSTTDLREVHTILQKAGNFDLAENDLANIEIAKNIATDELTHRLLEVLAIKIAMRKGSSVANGNVLARDLALYKGLRSVGEYSVSGDSWLLSEASKWIGIATGLNKDFFIRPDTNGYSTRDFIFFSLVQQSIQQHNRVSQLGPQQVYCDLPGSLNPAQTQEPMGVSPERIRLYWQDNANFIEELINVGKVWLASTGRKELTDEEKYGLAILYVRLAQARSCMQTPIPAVESYGKAKLVLGKVPDGRRKKLFERYLESALADEWINRAYYELKGEFFTRAEEIYEGLVEKVPTVECPDKKKGCLLEAIYPKAYLRLARLYLLTNRPRQAEELLDSLVSLDPDRIHSIEPATARHRILLYRLSPSILISTVVADCLRGKAYVAAKSAKDYLDTLSAQAPLGAQERELETELRDFLFDISDDEALRFDKLYSKPSASVPCIKG